MSPLSTAAVTPPDPAGPTCRVPELLAPAGDWDCARAAVENGADAIYFGLERFNARMRARNFTEADLPKLMEFLHRRGVRGYVTFNTLVFENELAEAESYLRTIITAGVDAAIVQDIGICRLIRELSSDFPIHASTQMTITSAAGVQFARQLGCNLVVLARECSLKDIAAIQPTAMASVTGQPSLQTEHASLPLEVFVHGALCVAYSGQCLTSEALGGRSANRGECAQACRLPYDLICDGQPVPLGDRRYLLSPQDLAGLEVLPELARAGVFSLKIEGRLKSPEYVANITRIYRTALDALTSGGTGSTPSLDSRRSVDSRADVEVSPPLEETRYTMEMSFSRGLYTGWLRGINNQRLVHGRFGKKRGVYLGEVTRVQGERVCVRLEAPLKPGDGIVFDAGHPDQAEQGGRVYGIETSRGAIRGPEAALTFGRGDIEFNKVHAGDKVWKTSDPELERRWRRTYAGEQPKYRRPVAFEVHGAAGRPLILRARDELGHLVQVESAVPLSPADHHPIGTERLREQFGRLGGTPFRLDELHNHLEGAVILPVSELNRLRREMVAQLESLRAQPKRWKLASRAASPRSSQTEPATGSTVGQAPELVVLVRSLPQLEAGLAAGVKTIHCEFEDPKRYREAVHLGRTVSAARRSPTALFVAPPRIFKSGEDWVLKQVRASDADGYLVRNYDHLTFFADSRCVGDFSLNIANRLTAAYFMERFRLERLTASYDLNITQLEALLAAAPADWFEVTIHQHMPMFHMEHCVFCAFLSHGTDYTNCGRPCDRHQVRLRDRVGAEHMLKADAGCRNTLFNARAQTGAEHVSRLMTLGVRRFRIEFLDESAEQAALTIAKYGQLLRGEITGAQLWRELKLVHQLGVTRGAMDRPESAGPAG